MALIYARTRLGAAAVGLALFVSACTVHKTEVPTVTGPSGLGISIDVSASPDVVTWDGVSQSRVVITARDSNGQPKSGLNARVDVAIGSLSQRSVSTDSSGQAALFFTAPPPPAVPVGTQTVQIQVTPLPDPASGGGNFANSTPRVASIMLVQPGVVVGPPSTLVPSFTVPSLNVGDPGVFGAKVVDSKGTDVTNQIVSFQWNFGDGGTASGQSVTHTFTRIGTFPVTLTITDSVGHTNSVTQSMTIGQGQLPTADIVVSPSPSSAVVNQVLNFNGNGSTAAPGHFISSFDWTFGDGTGGSGAAVTHSYSQAGNYTATLQVTDDAGRKSTVKQQPIAVTTGFPVALITVSPPSAAVNIAVSFIGSQSTVSPGRVIVSYSWDFGDGFKGSGPTTSHPYSKTGTYTVTLIVTDDQGNSGIATATVTIS